MESSAERSRLAERVGLRIDCGGREQADRQTVTTGGGTYSVWEKSMVSRGPQGAQKRSRHKR